MKAHSSSGCSKPGMRRHFSDSLVLDPVYARCGEGLLSPRSATRTVFGMHLRSSAWPARRILQLLESVAYSEKNRYAATLFEVGTFT